MRLNEKQIKVIQSSTIMYFGQTSRVWLFGSRTDDNQLGGDIDLYIQADVQSPDELIEAKLHFLSELHQKLGEQKIDVVIHRNVSEETTSLEETTSIYQIARQTGIRLL